MHLETIPLSPKPLFEIMFASIQTKLLIASIKLDIFEKLGQKQKSAQEIAEELEGNTVNTTYFLDGLTSLGLLEKNKGHYKNSILSETFLVRGKPTYLGDGFLLQALQKDLSGFDLQELVLKGPVKSTEKLGQSPEKWGRFAKNMANNQRSGTAQKAAEIVSNLPEFQSFAKMLDLGGGPGINCIAMVAQHSSMRGVVFDRKPSTDVASEFIKEYGMEDRIDVLAGDYNTDNIGRGYDFIWASYTLNFAQNNLIQVVKKIYDALNPGGVFINLSEGLTHEGTQPKLTVLCTAGWSMQNQPLKAFDQGIIADTMLEAGFRSVRSRTITAGWGEADLDIARKA